MESKTLFSFAICLFINSVSIAQKYQANMDYINTIEKYRKMRDGGKVITFLSPFVGILGGAIMVESYWEHGPPSPSAPYTIGLGMVVGGVIGTTTGISLWVTGAKRKRIYEKQIERQSVRVDASPETIGIRLSYHF